MQGNGPPPGKLQIWHDGLSLYARRVQMIHSGQRTLAYGYGETQTSAQQENELSEDNVVAPGDKPQGKSTDCPTVDFAVDADTFWPAVLSLDYSAQCTDREVGTLDGKIVATFDGLLLRPGTEIAIDFDRFSVNEYAVDGLYDVSNDGLDGEGRQSFGKSITGASFFRNDTALFIYEQEVVAYQVEGQDTDFFNTGLEGIFDDRYEAVVEGSGVFADGSPFSITTDQPILDASAASTSYPASWSTTSPAWTCRRCWTSVTAAAINGLR